MKSIYLFLLLLLVTTTSCSAQKVRQDSSGNYVAATNKDTTQFKATGKTYRDPKDKVYPVYVSEKGKLFYIRTSNNTGKQYKQYLKLEN